MIGTTTIAKGLGLLALVLPFAASADRPSSPEDGRAEAFAASEEGDWEQAAALFHGVLQREPLDVDVCEGYGLALLELGRADEAAHYLEWALERVPESDRKRHGALRKALAKADPHASRRAKLFENAVKKGLSAAETLLEKGHEQRALDLLVRVEPLARGEALVDIRGQLETLRSKFRQVDLDEAAATAPPGAWPLIRLESDHYHLHCNLEPDVVELIATTLDSVFGYFVQVYFDGDASRAQSRKVTIRIHSDHPSMMAEYPGGAGGSGVGGWWSSGDWRIVAYDTRTSNGSLDYLLETLFHEASHSFVSMKSRGGFAPAWINEGTSCFFEGTKAMADGRVLWPDVAGLRLYSLANDLRNSADRDLVDVIGWNSGASFAGELYPWGWGLVYFMQQYEDADTLERVYRPLYQEYLDTALSKGGHSMELFEAIFLGKNSPQGFEDLEAFEAFWREWILETVAPAHSGPVARDRRLASIARYREAAGSPELGRRRPRLDDAQTDFLERALGQAFAIARDIDSPTQPDPELLRTRIELLDLLAREEALAPAIEDLLALADEGVAELDTRTRATYERRLGQLDSKNSALRRARSDFRRVARSALALLEDYAEPKRSRDPEVEVQETPFLLRRYTLARQLGLALEDTRDLLPMSVELRESARGAGLLLGSVHRVEGPEGSWISTFDTQSQEDFTHAGGRVRISAGRPVSRVCKAVPVQGEYEIRTTLSREGDPRIGTANGIVVAGHEDGDWLVVDMDHEGMFKVRTLRRGRGGGVQDRVYLRLQLDPPVSDGEAPEIIAHMFPEGRMTLTVGDREPLDVELPGPLPATVYVGAYARYGTTVLDDLQVELYP